MGLFTWYRLNDSFFATSLCEMLYWHALSTLTGLATPGFPETLCDLPSAATQVQRHTKCTGLSLHAETAPLAFGGLVCVEIAEFAGVHPAAECERVV